MLFPNFLSLHSPSYRDCQLVYTNQSEVSHLMARMEKIPVYKKRAKKLMSLFALQDYDTTDVKEHHTQTSHLKTHRYGVKNFKPLDKIWFDGLTVSLYLQFVATFAKMPCF